MKRGGGTTPLPTLLRSCTHNFHTICFENVINIPVCGISLCFHVPLNRRNGESGETKFFASFSPFPASDGRDIFESDQTRQQQLQSSYQHGKNAKLSISEHREQYYQTVRKQSAQSPGLDSALERIPEYSEDIYPYATFHLKDQDKIGSARQAQGLIYESRETMLMSKKHRSSNSVISSGTGQRSRKKSKKFNTESEEYDSLNSDSDTVSRELDATSRTESSNCLDDPGPVNFSSEY